jgi:hypothetical protein
MTDPVQDTKPVPRKRRRWIVVGAAVLLLLIAGWWLGKGNSVIARARLIKVGQTRDEVIELMGQPQMSGTIFGQSPSEGYGDMTQVELIIRVLVDQYLGFETLNLHKAFPVEIEYDAARRVSQVVIHESDD